MECPELTVKTWSLQDPRESRDLRDPRENLVRTVLMVLTEMMVCRVALESLERQENRVKLVNLDLTVKKDPRERRVMLVPRESLVMPEFPDLTELMAMPVKMVTMDLMVPTVLPESLVLMDLKDPLE